jgi:hypothetical protein
MYVFEYHNTEMKTTLEWGTQKNYFTTRRYVEEYLKAHLRTSDVFLSQLNYRFLTEFERFMKAYVPKDQKLPLWTKYHHETHRAFAQGGKHGHQKRLARLRFLPEVPTLIY